MANVSELHVLLVLLCLLFSALISAAACAVARWAKLSWPYCLCWASAAFVATVPLSLQILQEVGLL